MSEVTDSPIFAASSGLNAGALDSRTLVTFPFDGFEASNALAGSFTPDLPIDVISDSYVGAMAPMFVEDWYGVIHISETLLALGNVVSSQVRTIGVWNAHLDSTETLNALSATGATGIVVTGPGSLPLVFARNEEKEWTFAIDVVGPPTVDAVFVWEFADSESVRLEITGARVTPWAAFPDWANGISERLAWKTDVLVAWSGAEQRRALRLSPRRIFSFTALISAQDKRATEAALFAWSAMVWALPIWPDGEILTAALAPGATTVPADTVNRDYVDGGLAILINNAASYEVLQIDSVASNALALSQAVIGNWSAGASRLFPVRTARLQGFPQITRYNADFVSIQAQFVTVEACDWASAFLGATYRSLPVLENRPSEGSLGATYTRQMAIIDPETGVFAVDDTAQKGFPLTTHEWWLDGRSARAAFRSLLYALRGRQGALWVPTYQQDVLLSALAASSATNIDVEWFGYTRYLVGQLNRRDIRIELNNGQIFYRRITGASELSAAQERLSINASLGQDVSPGDIRAISFMAMCRLDADEIEIAHLTNSNGLALATTSWRAINLDV